MKKTMMEKATIEISLEDLWDWIMKGIVFILAIAILFGAAAFAYNKYFVAPVYSASVKFYASGIETSPTLGQSVAPQYVEFLNVNEFYELVSKDLKRTSGMEISPKQIAAMLSFSSVVEDTSSFFVKVVALDPNTAYNVALSVAAMGPEQVQGFSDVGALEVIEKPQLPTSPVGAGAVRGAIIGFVIGFILASGIVILKEILGNRIKNPDEITELFGIPVFGVVPEFSSTNKNGGSN